MGGDPCRKGFATKTKKKELVQPPSLPLGWLEIDERKILVYSQFFFAKKRHAQLSLFSLSVFNRRPGAIERGTGLEGAS